MSKEQLHQISELNWKESKGVTSQGQTNSMLAPRDYSINCKLDYVIAITNGVWNWYCTPHHQPSSHCERGKLKHILDSNCLVIFPENRNKHSVDEYGRPTLNHGGQE